MSAPIASKDIIDHIEDGRPQCGATREVNGKFYRCRYKERHTGNHYHSVAYWVETTPGNQRQTTKDERFSISWGDPDYEGRPLCDVPWCEDKSRLSMAFMVDWDDMGPDARNLCQPHAVEVLAAIKARDER